MKINYDLQAGELTKKLAKFWSLSGDKIRLIEKEYDNGKGAPEFRQGKYYTFYGYVDDLTKKQYQYGNYDYWNRQTVHSYNHHKTTWI